MQHLPRLAVLTLLSVLKLGASSQSSAEVKQESVTVLQIHKPRAHWTLRNFHLFWDKSPYLNFRISSPVIYEDQWGHWAMSVTLKPTEVETARSSSNYNEYSQKSRPKSRYWSLEVQITATNTSKEIFIPPTNMSAAVLGGPAQKTLIDKVSLDGSNKNWYRSTFIKTKQLEDNLKTYAPANDLTLWFEITQESSFHLVDYKDTESAAGKAAANTEGSLAMQLFQAYQHGKWTDSQLKSSDGVLFPVHKVVLASMSSVLDAMLRNNTEISTDLPGSILREFVGFLYTGAMSKTMAVAETLLVAAETYQMPKLKDECQRVLMDHITSESVTKLLVLAETHNAQKLKSVALDFVVRNFQQVSKTASWKKTLRTHPELTIDSVMAVVAKITST